MEKKILIILIVFLVSCSSRDRVINAVETANGCFYKTFYGLQFSDRECRYKIGDEIEPYSQRSTYKSKHSH